MSATGRGSVWEGQKEPTSREQLDAYFDCVHDLQMALKTLRKMSDSSNRHGDLLYTRAAWNRAGQALKVLIEAEETR